MPKVCYVSKNFSAGSREVIDNANDIIDEYQKQGFDLTLRQLYYQMVTQNLIVNTKESYKRLGSIIADARLAGEVDWKAIVDRTRKLEKGPDWESPASIVDACANQFRLDKWADQENRPEVWIEKDALTGVIEKVCKELQVPYFSCRGYTSLSEMWVAAQRLIGYREDLQEPVIIHLGDHDPSGIDMTRDIIDRLDTFMGVASCEAQVIRIALNMDQVQKYGPPPNPTKVTDSRAPAYIKKHGHDSWELDALKPQVMTKLIRQAVRSVRDDTLWKKQREREKAAKAALRFASDNWGRIQAISDGEDWDFEPFDEDEEDEE